MEIFDALDTLSGFIDMLSDQGALTDEEIDQIGEAEDTIYNFVKEHQDNV